MSTNSKKTKEIYKNIDEIKSILSEPKMNITQQNKEYYFIPFEQIYSGTQINSNQEKEIYSYSNPNQITSQNININPKLISLKNLKDNNEQNNFNLDNKLRGLNKENYSNEKFQEVNEKKIKTLIKEEIENLIFPLKEDFKNNLKRQNNFIYKEDYQNNLNEINKQIKSLYDNIKEINYKNENNFKLNKQKFINKNEYEESINNFLEKISQLEKKINENNIILNKKIDESLTKYEINEEKKNLIKKMKKNKLIKKIIIYRKKN